MSTSFNLNVDQCIETAIRDSGGQPSQFEELQAARTYLNLLFNEWSTQNVNLWKVEFVDVTIPASTVDVTLSSDIIRPIHISMRYGATTSTDLAMKPMSYTDYNVLPKKDQTGRPTQYVSQRQRDNAVLKLWPVPAEETVLKICALKRFNDVNSPIDSVDAPTRFLPALTYGLAYRLALSRSDGSEQWEAKLNRLEREATRTWMLATNEDQDYVPLRIEPMMRNR